MSGVRAVVPNQEKDELLGNFLTEFPDIQPTLETWKSQPVPLEDSHATDCRKPIPGARMRTRAFIKVQDGCDNLCTFCVARLARGPSRSRAIEEILEDIEAASGAKEIVLTGLHLGSWGQDFSPPSRLQQLVELILDRTNIPRLRLSSLEPWDLDEQFIRIWENPRLCRHLHLPLQSGCASTLRRMGRNISPGSFAELVATIRDIAPEAAITTDIITGFPGESEVEFQESIHFLQAMRFAGGHVFTYSARPGTSAASMSGQVPHPLRKERNTHLRAVFKEASLSYQAGFTDQVLPVLWESVTQFNTQEFEMSGLTGNYIRVTARASRNLWNQITPVRLTRLVDGHIEGEIIQ